MCYFTTSQNLVYECGDSPKCANQLLLLPIGQYGLASDEAAAMAIARRGMRLKEILHGDISVYLAVKAGKHVWSQWSQLNNQIKKFGVRRHCFYSISNWESLVKQWSEQSGQSKRKRIAIISWNINRACSLCIALFTCE